MASNDPINRYAAASPARAGQEATESPAARLLRLWQDGSAPDLDAFLAGSGNLSPVQLAAVLRVDQRERWRLGQYIPAETYLHRCPRLRDDEEGATDLVYGEYLLREKRGAAPVVEEFLWRFPNLASALVPQIELHRALQAAPALAADATATLPAGLPALAEPETVIGPFRLLEQIGEGSFGVVYRAEQSQPVRREVALKILKPGMDSRQVVARFEAERQALALMDHPNIARVFDGGETASGRPYFVMELVRGEPITDYCDRNRLTPRQRLELFITVCQAVQHAHQKGVIHRDLKPSNVLVAGHDTTPVPKIIDFGIAKAIGQELTDKTLHSVCALMVGTPLYMSPEQAGMSGLDVDTRSDIYSLGALLYELLTGTTPFDRERLRTAGYDEMRRIIAEEEHTRPSTRLGTLGQAVNTVATNRATEPSKLGRLIRGDLDWIVMKALEKDRTRRYETANGFAADVQRYLTDEPVLACPPSVGYRLRKLARRHKGPVLAASLLVLALVGGVIGTTWGLVRAINARADAVTEAGKKDAALTAAQQSKRVADETLFASYQDQSRALRVSRRPGQRFESLAVLRRATELARTLGLPDEKFHDLRNAAVAALALPDLHPAGPWHLWPADAHAVDFDETHTLYARTNRRGECSVRRMADDAEVRHLPGLGRPSSPHLSRDGKFLAVFHFTGGPPQKAVALKLWDLGPTGARQILSEERARGAAFHPHLPQVALAYENGAIGLFELPGGRPLKRLPPVNLTREIGIALHPTEPVVAVCSYFGSVVQLRDLASGEVLAALPQDGRPSGLDWHPDGRTLAVSLVEAGRILLYDHATLQVVRTLESTQNITGVAFNPAGDRLVATGWEGLADLFDVGTGQRLFVNGPTSGGLRFSRDGGRLTAVQAGKLGSWQVGGGREYRTLVRNSMPEKAGFTYSVDVSPDGRLVAASMTDGIGIWDLASGSELAFIPTGGVDSDNRVLFEPSGALLTLCSTGLFRWPIAKESGGARQWVLGPPSSTALVRRPCVS